MYRVQVIIVVLFTVEEGPCIDYGPTLTTTGVEGNYLGVTESLCRSGAGTEIGLSLRRLVSYGTRQCARVTSFRRSSESERPPEAGSVSGEGPGGRSVIVRNIVPKLLQPHPPVRRNGAEGVLYCSFVVILSSPPLHQGL